VGGHRCSVYFFVLCVDVDVDVEQNKRKNMSYSLMAGCTAGALFGIGIEYYINKGGYDWEQSMSVVAAIVVIAGMVVLFFQRSTPLNIDRPTRQDLINAVSSKRWGLVGISGLLSIVMVILTGVYWKNTEWRIFLIVYGVIAAIISASMYSLKNTTGVNGPAAAVESSREPVAESAMSQLFRAASQTDSSGGRRSTI
jgi:sugar phosphate permease